MYKVSRTSKIPGRETRKLRKNNDKGYLQIHITIFQLHIFEHGFSQNVEHLYDNPAQTMIFYYQFAHFSHNFSQTRNFPKNPVGHF